MTKMEDTEQVIWSLNAALVKSEQERIDRLRRVVAGLRGELAAVTAERDVQIRMREAFSTEAQQWQDIAEAAEAKLAAVEKAATAADGMCANCHHGDLIWAALRGEGDRG